MTSVFEKKNKEELLASIDRGLEQGKRGETFDAVDAVKDMTKELEAGYQAMKTIRSQKMAANR